MILPAKVPTLIRKIYPRRTWQVDTTEPVLYITFDDGPHERITPRVLSLLANHQAKASFFCIGDRVEKHPECFAQIKAGGHVIGNHSYHHLNGWKTDTDAYVADVSRADVCIGSNMFRPPYGRLRGRQFRRLEELGMKTIMWTILSGDYDHRLSPEACASRVLRSLEPGAIILFHDSEKAERNMFFALEKLLEVGAASGYAFSALDLQ